MLISFPFIFSGWFDECGTVRIKRTNQQKNTINTRTRSNREKKTDHKYFVCSAIFHFAKPLSLFLWSNFSCALSQFSFLLVQVDAFAFQGFCSFFFSNSSFSFSLTHEIDERFKRYEESFLSYTVHTRIQCARIMSSERKNYHTNSKPRKKRWIIVLCYQASERPPPNK